MSSDRFAIPAPRVIYDEWSLEDVIDAYEILRYHAEVHADAMREAGA